ncbi:hypothetical protein L798_13816 [Zootermopsis nevadensis]|uniref:DDE Tnp4 domain-containing protein n=1 Tax=Zootermopsis nevadensis TaxID=136037 RepID=A0A067R0P0_ZOONE|nr:hypothetical protein L798_13816 [Zootermopsis nevadensis]
MHLLQAPNAVQDWQHVYDVFAEKWHFPGCAGSVDGKHVTIQAPSNSGSYFFNYKSYHSTVLMAAVDAQYSFLAVNIGCNGRVSDDVVFAASGIPGYLERQLWRIVPAVPLSGRVMSLHPVVIEDEAFPLRPNLMKPYARNTENWNVTHRVFNL